jgi:hypothetical protein
MRTIGMKFRKTVAIPAKADWEKQEEFKKTHWSLQRDQRTMDRRRERR